MTIKIGEQLQKIRDLEKLRDQTQSMIDTAIYELITIAGGKTFEYSNKYYQIRVPNTSRTDRLRAATQHPFLCELDESPKTAKARAKERRESDKAAKALADKAAAEAKVQANLEALLAPRAEEETEDDAVLRANNAAADIEHTEDESDGFSLDNDEGDIDAEPLAASDEDLGDDDGIVLTGGE